MRNYYTRRAVYTGPRALPAESCGPSFQTRRAPPGLHLGQIQTRFADALPQSYDKEARTVDAVMSMGSPVKRFYGTEVLRIDPDSVLLDRLRAGGIPVLDSHQQFGINNSLGRVQKAWFANGALMGRLAFNATPEGRKAEGMVARGEISGVSAGYVVEEWEIRDGENKILDPEIMRIPFDDDDLTFTATRWRLMELSLCSIPADPQAVIRSFGNGVANSGSVGIGWPEARRIRNQMRDERFRLLGDAVGDDG
jgi:hypothetical protein